MNEHERAMTEAINAARAGRGLPSLRDIASLIEAARGHAADMATHPGMVHEGSDGSDGGRRMLEAGYHWSKWGEIVGWGFGGNVSQMMAWWLSSPAHRPYLLDGDMRDLGVGYVAAPGSMWGHYWTVDFGRRDEVEEPPAPAPKPYASYVPMAAGGTVAAGTDLLPYLRGDGRTYRVGNAWGSFEVFQSQAEGDRFFQIKAWDDLSVVNWEEFIVSDSHIGRDVDTSPGGGRFYRQSLNGSPGAPWVKRRMGISESFSQTKRVQFYRLDNCAAVEQHSGTVTDTITLVEHLSEWRSPFGVVVPDVVVLKWEQGGELYRFGRGYGLVGWSRAHQDPHSPAWSGIAEMRPDVGRLARLRIDCL
jgi:hypothetical protein